MKTYILIPLVLLSFASVALTKHKPFLVVTVLFYNDDKGHQIVAAGKVPKKIRTLIGKDIKLRNYFDSDISTIIKVTPLLRQLKDSPAAGEMIGFVKEKFNNVFIAELPKWLASKVVHEKSEKMNLKNTTNLKLHDLDKDTKNNDEVVNTNSISEGNKDNKDMLSINDIAAEPKPYYMPNTVFYAVETKCKTPTDYTCYSANRGPKSYNKTSKNSFKELFKKTKSLVSQV